MIGVKNIKMIQILENCLSTRKIWSQIFGEHLAAIFRGMCVG